MKITPLDVRKQEFKRGFRGYDTIEVRTFLGLAAQEFEEVVRERANLSERVGHLDQDLAEYKEKERLLESALIAAERVAEQTRENARREGELAVKEAELCAERMLNQARQEVLNLHSDLEELKVRRNVFLARLRSFLQSQLDILESELEDGRFAETEKARQDG